MNEIVSTCQFRDYVLIFTRDGTIYKMYVDELSGEIRFLQFVNLFPHQK